MVALRSARLEALIGSRLEDADYAQLMTLISNNVAEAFDLDYKRELYGNSERDRQHAATDVAALANTAGGLLILGIAEDAQARAVQAPGVPLTDAEERRIRQIIGSLVVPLPALDFIRVEDPARPGHGLMLIAVPRSPLAPHGVIVNDALRYSHRNGALKRHLSEPEVASAYRQRFAAVRQQADRARDIEADAILRMEAAGQVWVMVSLVPDLAGQLLIDHETLNAVRGELLSKTPLILNPGLTWKRVSIGQRRLLADGSTERDGMARWLSADLHDDGSGVFSMYVLTPRYSPESEETAPIDDEFAVTGILSGLRFLARHARDRAAAGGSALIRAQVVPERPPVPLRLVHRDYAFTDEAGSRTLDSSPLPAERAATLESLASDSPELAAATYLLATEIFQGFGLAEASQFTRDGHVRLRGWSNDWRPRIQQWATDAGIPVQDT
jgi:hypothetical protein